MRVVLQVGCREIGEGGFSARRLRVRCGILTASDACAQLERLLARQQHSQIRPASDGQAPHAPLDARFEDEGLCAVGVDAYSQPLDYAVAQKAVAVPRCGDFRMFDSVLAESHPLLAPLPADFSHSRRIVGRRTSKEKDSI